MNAYPMFPRQGPPNWAIALLACMGAALVLTLVTATVIVLRDPAFKAASPKLPTAAIATPATTPATTATAEGAPTAPPVANLPSAAAPAPAVAAVGEPPPVAAAAPPRHPKKRHRAISHATAHRGTNVASSKAVKGKAPHKKDDLDRILGLY